MLVKNLNFVLVIIVTLKISIFYTTNSIPVNDRTCLTCSISEDEPRFVLECCLYNGLYNARRNVVFIHTLTLFIIIIYYYFHLITQIYVLFWPQGFGLMVLSKHYCLDLSYNTTLTTCTVLNLNWIVYCPGAFFLCRLKGRKLA